MRGLQPKPWTEAFSIRSLKEAADVCGGCDPLSALNRFPFGIKSLKRHFRVPKGPTSVTACGTDVQFWFEEQTLNRVTRSIRPASGFLLVAYAWKWFVEDRSPEVGIHSGRFGLAVSDVERVSRD